MGVDGIDKADIFDEYFDDDKPKVTNFEKIKAMDIYDMATWLKMLCVTLSPDDVDEDFVQWLKSEVRE